MTAQKRFSKKRLLFITLTCALILAITTGSFFLIAGGRKVTKDGLLQNSRIFLTDLYYKDGQLHCTVVNKTPKDFYCPEKPTAEKQIDGEWQSFPFFCRPSLDLGVFFPAFSNTEYVVDVDLNQDMLPGNYRITLGYQTTQPFRPGASAELVRQEGDVGAVGYLTIAPEDAPPVDPDMYYSAPYRHSRKATMALEESSDLPSPYRYQYRIKNSGSKPLVLCFSDTANASPALYQYTGEQGGNYQIYSGTQVVPAPQIILQPGEEYLLPLELDIAHEGGNVYELENGEYYAAFPCYWQGEESTAFTVAIAFKITNGGLF